MKKIIYSLAFFLLGIGVSEAQSIRKPTSEMTPSEQAAYVAAINQLQQTLVNGMATEHRRLSSQIHVTASTFLPWHRIFLKYLEEQIQAINPDLSLPYWNWYEKVWTSTDPLFMNANSSNHDGLFVNNINSNVWDFDRHMMGTWTAPGHNTTTTNFTTFSNSLENGPHNNGHMFIGSNGGTMGMMISPNDPMFYLHHCMVDKEWSDWYELNPTADVSVLRTDMPTFNVPGHPQTTVNARDYVDTRVEDVWYAKNGSVILNKYTVTSNKRYYYTTGAIIAKDNFIINSGATGTLQAVSVKLQEGFKVSSGASVSISLLPAQQKSAFIGSPSFADNTNSNDSKFSNIIKSSSEEIAINLYPNPSSGIINISLKGENRGYKSIRVIDVNGKIVLQSKIEANGQQQILNLSNKPKGVYIIHIIDSESTTYKRLVLN